METISLTDVRAEREREKQREPLTELLAFVDGLENDLGRVDGWAVVAYRRLDDGDVAVSTSYRVRDPLDVYALPEMARHKLERCINKTTDGAN